MNVIFRIWTAFFVLTLLFLDATAQVKRVKDLQPTVILISLDGFHPDYLRKYAPETLNKLAKEGVRADWMIPAFPSKTFPNHYTVATGLYPENHGIVENNIYDFGTIFGLGKREEVQNGRWWLGEPIWVTAEKQGQRAGAFFFPGTEAQIAGVRPTFWKEYDGKVTNEARVDQILQWLDLPVAKRPTFYTLYFSDTDDAGHSFSPDSKQVAEAVGKVDKDLRRLMEGLKERKIDKKVNLIITSDHGMATVYQKNAVFLDDAFDVKRAERILWTGEIVQIFPKANEEDAIITNLQTKVRNADCWRKREIPARFHYSSGARIAPIICSAHEGWVLTNRERFKQTARREDFLNPKGAHGYDNQLPSMRALFIAHGKAFRKKLVIKPFENVHIYNVMTKILNLSPAKNDGDERLAKEILRKR